VPEEKFWILWCNGRLTEADKLTIRLGATPSGLTSAHLHHPPYFLRLNALPAAQPTVSKHLRQLAHSEREKTLEFSSTVIPAPSLYLTVRNMRIIALMHKNKNNNSLSRPLTNDCNSLTYPINAHMQMHNPVCCTSTFGSGRRSRYRRKMSLLAFQMFVCQTYHHHHITTVLWPFFRDHPGELVPEQNFWTLWCKGRLTEADTPTMGATPSRLSSAHLHHPIFYRPDALPAAQPTVSKH